MIEVNAAPGIHRLEDAFTNWFLVEEDGRFTLVDACVPAAWESLGSAVERLGRGLDDIEALVLTHAHFDHIGVAERVRRELGIPVYVHDDDVPLTRKPLLYGRERSPLRYVATQPRALPIIATFLRTRAFWPPPIGEVRRYRNGELPVPGSPRVIPTPGHTIGHCSLHLPDRDALIAGDAVVTLDPYTASKGPRIVARSATADTERAMGSLDAIAETGATTVLTGHGPVWREGAAEAARRARAAGIA
jgi:glyoxylase-like metal-dependent hydrolase (beta-lactamase superfamily II)